MLELEHDASLRTLNSFGVEAHAAMLARVDDSAELPGLFAAVADQGLPWLALGEGSNVLFVDNYPGVLVQPQLPGIDALDDDGDQVRLRVGAGENWHRLVADCLDRGLCGLENLALIPGSVGAAPVQNIGAYGVELDRFVVAVEAFDVQAGALVRLAAGQCGFAYRDSRFKREPGRWLITAVELALPRRAEPVTGYAGVAEALAARGVDGDHATAREVFDAVCDLRRRKLPDPAQIGNAGSFFKNPVVPALQAAFIADHHPGLPAWPAGADHSKLSAAWLIEQCGLKGHRQGDAAVSDRHALVLVNHGQATGAQLWALAEVVRDTVEARFGVRLEPEPRIIGAATSPDR
jgi:UDP-N-acetylmuramate dehydrogenase